MKKMIIFSMPVVILISCRGTTRGCKSSSNEERKENYLDDTERLGLDETPNNGVAIKLFKKVCLIIDIFRGKSELFLGREVTFQLQCLYVHTILGH